MDANCINRFYFISILKQKHGGGRFLGWAVLFVFKTPETKNQKKNQNLGFFVEKNAEGDLNVKKKNRPKNRPPHFFIPSNNIEYGILCTSI